MLWLCLGGDRIAVGLDFSLHQLHTGDIIETHALQYSHFGGQYFPVVGRAMKALRISQI